MKETTSAGYLVPAGSAEAEFVERKSRFIGRCARITTEQEALDFVADIRRRHRDASHNVYAYRLRDNAICRHSDDGEPSGTAGLPLLDGFLKREIYDFVCVATRYFGGILLGGGGLIRAYAHTGMLALDAAGVATMRPWQRLRLCVPYALYEQVNRLLPGCGALDIRADFGAEVQLRFVLTTEELPALQKALTELSAGALHPEDEGVVWEAR